MQQPMPSMSSCPPQVHQQRCVHGMRHLAVSQLAGIPCRGVAIRLAGLG